MNNIKEVLDMYYADEISKACAVSMIESYLKELKDECR